MFGKISCFSKKIDKILFMPLFIKYFPIVFGVIILYFWTIVLFSQNKFSKKLMRIIFEKEFLDPNGYSKQLFTKYSLAIYLDQNS